MKQQFGKIYGGNNNPTHGVYTENNIKVWGDRATAISHHWSKDEADAAAKKESELRREPCVVVVYE
jgi:hypothetical protein